MALSDAKIFELDKEAQEVEERIKRLESRKAKIKGAIIKEMERRGTKGLERGGIALTYVQQEIVTYKPTLLKEKKIPLAVRKRITKEELDKAALADEVAKGTIDPAIVAKHSEVKPKAPYYTRAKTGR